MEQNIKTDMELLKIFSKRIKMLRLEKGLTLKELEKILLEKYELKLSYGNLANYERGYRSPYIFALNAFSDFYDVSVDWLLGKTDERNATILETEYENKNIKIAVDKDSDLANMPLKDVVKLVKELQEMGIDFNTIKKNVE
jgi:transcriptional regulator with XRE-family HTH domain